MNAQAPGTDTGSGPSVAVLSSASGGGGGIAALRLAEALRAHGGLSADFIDITGLGQTLPFHAAPFESFSNRIVTDTHFTAEHPGFSRGWMVGMLRRYDLVNIHWASYLISLAELHALAAAGRPMLFWLHDFHYITGGCHYPAGCDGLLGDCRGCPQLDIRRSNPAVTTRALAVKREIFAHSNVHLSAPSAFLRDRAVAAGIVPASRAHVLRNAYAPRAPFDAGRPPGGRVLLIADSLAEQRKNMGRALEALSLLAAHQATEGTAPELVVDVVGQTTPELTARLVEGRVAHVLHGRITDHTALTAILARSDVVLSCSLEDNWPNILVEAGCYGVMPVVGPGHGCAEFVRRYGFGHVTEDYSAPAFARALRVALAGCAGGAEQRRRAAEAIRADHAPARVAAQFARLAQDLLTAGDADPARPRQATAI